MSRGKTRAVLLDSAAICSVLTQAALFGVIITLALVDLSLTRLKGYILAASALDGILVLALLAIVVKILADPHISATELFLVAACSALSLCALTLSLYIFANVWTTYHFKTSDLRHSVTACLAVTGIVLCSIAILMQVLMYPLLLLPARNGSTPSSIAASSPRRFSVTLKAFTSPASPSRRQLTLYSPSLASSRSLNLSRPSSFNQVWGAFSSKTRLASNPAFPQDSVTQLSRKEGSLEITCRGDITELISAAEPYELSSSPPQRLNLSRGRLETIPGSRPVSPAKPLESYLFDEIKPEDFPLPDSPTLSRGNSPVYIGSPYEGLPFPPMIGEIATSSQTHIHPLFRSDSPGPHPDRTPGTKVVASPYAGQVVSSSHALARKLKDSRPTTPARSPVPSIEKSELPVPNFSRPNAPSKNESRKAGMF